MPQPGKVVCAGLNYRSHIEEMGRPLPAYPTLFAKFADTLTGPYDEVEAVAEDPRLDWEGELAVVVGRTAYRVGADEAAQHIAGYTVANDISMRGWQNRTNEWLQGKAWARSTPVGPVLVTPDELDLATATLRTTVNEEVVQEHALADLLFNPADLVSYVSQFVPLRPGDLLLTGTPGGVGHARTPQRYLREGDTVEVRIDGIGAVSNRIVGPGARQDPWPLTSPAGEPATSGSPAAGAPTAGGLSLGAQLYGLHGPIPSDAARMAYFMTCIR